MCEGVLVFFVCSERVLVCLAGEPGHPEGPGDVGSRCAQWKQSCSLNRVCVFSIHQIPFGAYSQIYLIQGAEGKARELLGVSYVKVYFPQNEGKEHQHQLSLLISRV